MNNATLVNAPFQIISKTGEAASLTLLRSWHNGEMTSVLLNQGQLPVSVDNVVLLQWEHGLPAQTPIHGEGFQMLSQTGGRLVSPQPLGRCDDGEFYRIYTRQDGQRVFNSFIFAYQDVFTLLGFTSCRRFCGYIRFDQQRFAVVLDLEGITLCPGERVILEGFTVLSDPALPALMLRFSEQLARSHPPRGSQQLPRGWCSWYHYYENVTAADIRENLQQLGHYPALEYVQIDDGYQAFMGDWLTPSERFPQGVKALINDIRQAGKKAGIWLAPFIAEPSSQLFREHPDWFVKRADGTPLPADEVTYGGWRCTPWFMLDGTHPGAIAYLKQVVSTMRHEWKVDYFKLDANFWGAAHGAVRHRDNATRIEAYREAMQAICTAADGAFVLGCNAPMWPSLGLVDGMRVADDIERKEERIVQLRDETFHRNWMHQRLWLNDPDCLVLRNLPGQQASVENYRLHLTIVIGSGGMVMSGDRLPCLDHTQRSQLENAITLSQKGYSAARFNTLDCAIGICQGNGSQLVCLTNTSAQPREFTLPVAPDARIELLVGEGLRCAQGRWTMRLQPYDGAVVKAG